MMPNQLQLEQSDNMETVIKTGKEWLEEINSLPQSVIAFYGKYHEKWLEPEKGEKSSHIIGGVFRPHFFKFGKRPKDIRNHMPFFKAEPAWGKLDTRLLWQYDRQADCDYLTIDRNISENLRKEIGLEGNEPYSCLTYITRTKTNRGPVPALTLFIMPTDMATELSLQIKENPSIAFDLFQELWVKESGLGTYERLQEETGFCTVPANKLTIFDIDLTKEKFGLENATTKNFRF